MIKLGNTSLTDIGLKCSKITGLWDFPAIKNEGIDWKDADYIDIPSRTIDFQYQSRKIVLDCFVSGSNWSDIKTKINNLINAFIFDGLKMLTIPSISKRGYMVRFDKSTIFEPSRTFRNGKTVAEFKLQLEEPQPFNIQFYFEEEETTTLTFSLQIINAMKSLSTGSSSQKFVKVCWMDQVTEVNIEQEDFAFSGSMTFAAGIPYPVVILGEIDSLQLTGIQTNLTPKGVNLANLFMRNTNGELQIV